jgi:predicted nucleic acid-binding protein
LAEVDPGEAEAIALAIQLPEAVLLVDDLRARRVAVKRRLRTIGTVGLLMRAKKEGLVEALRPLLNDLVANGIHLGQKLIDAALAEVGEN